MKTRKKQEYLVAELLLRPTCRPISTAIWQRGLIPFRDDEARVLASVVPNGGSIIRKAIRRAK